MKPELFHILGTILLLGMLLPAAWIDIRTRKIPNRLTFFGMAFGLLLRSFLGPEELGLGLLGGLIAFVFAFPFFLVGALGAGDGKLLIAVGLLMGPEKFFVSLLLIGVLGGVLSLLAAVRQGRLLDTFRNVKFLLVGWFLNFSLTGSLRPPSSPLPTSSVTVPYGVAICLGAIAGWFL